MTTQHIDAPADSSVDGWTVLRVVDAGVVLLEAHLARFSNSAPQVRGEVEKFVREAAPGVYALDGRGDRLTVLPRTGSFLRDDLPVRVMPSPVAHRPGPIAKPGPPGPYDPVRSPAVLTLLTSPDGTEFWECCIAALAAWDGHRWLFPPPDRPRVASVSEAALFAGGMAGYAPLRVNDPLPLAAINAVQGACRVTWPGRPPVPQEALEQVSALFRSLTRRVL